MRNEIKAIIKKLKEVQNKVQGYAENAILVNAEDRANELEFEVEAIETAIESLKEIE